MAGENRNIFSHQLASLAGLTPAQVRRDIMSVGYSGSPTRGYDVRELAESIGNFLDAPKGQGVALIGVGNLGRAIMAYFAGRRPKLAIVAAFDKDTYKVNRVIHGCRCYAIEDLTPIIEQFGIKVAIIAVPASDAQNVAETLVRSGVRGIMNFAPVPLKVPRGTYVLDVDITTSLEKVAYFSRQTPDTSVAGVLSVSSPVAGASPARNHGQVLGGPDGDAHATGLAPKESSND
jgi:redox-sensing transcriptional repressor